MVKPSTKPLYSALGDPLRILGWIIVHLIVGNKFTITLFPVVDKIAFDVLLGTTFIKEHILAILPDGQNTTFRDLNSAAIIGQENMPANSVLTIQSTEKVLNDRRSTTCS